MMSARVSLSAVLVWPVATRRPETDEPRNGRPFGVRRDRDQGRRQGDPSAESTNSSVPSTKGLAGMYSTPLAAPFKPRVLDHEVIADRSPVFSEPAMERG